MNRVLLILEVSKKQDYIFGSKRLKENASRSANIAYVTSNEFFKAVAADYYSENDNLISTGGGHSILQFADRKTAVNFAGKVTEAAFKMYDGLELFSKITEYDFAKTPRENINALTEALEMKKALRTNSFKTVAFGIETKPDSKDSVSGREVLEPPAGHEYFKDAESIKDDNFLAVVHIDGNNMGNRVQSIYDKYTSWDECVKGLGRFSNAVQENFTAAFREVEKAIILKYPETEILPIRPIILAGDDVCFVSSGKIGLECARIFLEALSRITNPEQPEIPYSACAGVALVHSKYPFHKAYDIAEELCSNAKKFGMSMDSSGKISAMDWHIEFGQLKDSVSELREA